MSLTKQELEARIRRRFATTTAPIQLDELQLPFTRITQPDSVLDAAVEDEQRRQSLPPSPNQPPVSVPYWAELWESSLGLALFLARTPMTGLTVLDLGCGMGLAGAAAAAAGADVLMADLEPSALLLARLNTWPWRRQVRLRRVNWQLDDLSERFDRILGADILYEAAQWDYLNRFWRNHLAPAGEILLGEPGRQTGDRFPDWAAAHGWTVENLTQAVPNLPRPVRIFRLTPQ